MHAVWIHVEKGYSHTCCTTVAHNSTQGAHAPNKYRITSLEFHDVSMISRPVRDNVPQSPRLSHQQLMRMPSHQLRLQRAADGILRLMPVAQGVTDRTTPPPYSQRSYLSLNSLPGSQPSFREPTPHPDCGLTNRSSSTLTRSCPPDSTRRLSFSEKRRFGLAWKRPRGPTTRAAHPSASRGAAAPSHRFCDREQWRGQPFHHPPSVAERTCEQRALMSYEYVDLPTDRSHMEWNFIRPDRHNPPSARDYRPLPRPGDWVGSTPHTAAYDA